MLTIKQGQLLSQLEAFDQECENMRDQLEAARDSTTNTTCELSDVVQQKQQLHSENTRLQVGGTMKELLLIICIENVHTVK